MKTAIILHGRPDEEEYYSSDYPSASNSHWIPWLQKQLLMRDIHAQTPEVPYSHQPKYQLWKKEFERFEINSDTVIVGHSTGGGFFVRLLSEESIKVGKVFLVAPWIDTNKILDTDMFDFELDSKIVDKTDGITIFNSTDDMSEIQDSVTHLMETVASLQLVEFSDKGHFTKSSLGAVKFPELLKTICET